MQLQQQRRQREPQIPGRLLQLYMPEPSSSLFTNLWSCNNTLTRVTAAADLRTATGQWQQNASKMYDVSDICSDAALPTISATIKNTADERRLQQLPISVTVSESTSSTVAAVEGAVAGGRGSSSNRGSRGNVSSKSKADGSSS